MTGESGVTLPASGLAEDILARFMNEAQEKEGRKLAAAEEVAEQTAYHLVTFLLAKEEYGVEIGSVQEIIRAADITPVPGAPSHIRGVINLRGKIIPVVDLRARFGLPEGTDDDQRRIVVVEAGVKRLGMLVDSVSQVIKIPAAVVEDLPEEAVTLDENFIQGIGKLEGRLIVILDLKRSLLFA